MVKAAILDAWSRMAASTRGAWGRMIRSLLIGAGLAFAAAVQPGPLQAFLVSRVATAGWRRTLPACLSPLLSDGPIALVAVLVLGRLPDRAQRALSAAGGLLLLYLAWSASRQWRQPRSRARVSAPKTLIEAALVNVVNPNPYLGWALVLGPAVVAAWRERPAGAVVLVLAFYATMVTVLALFVALSGAIGSLGAPVQRALAVASTLVLAGLGVFLLASGLRFLLPSAGAALLPLAPASGSAGS